jgi:hypothetical protein
VARHWIDFSVIKPMALFFFPTGHHVVDEPDFGFVLGEKMEGFGSGVYAP